MTHVRILCASDGQDRDGSREGDERSRGSSEFQGTEATPFLDEADNAVGQAWSPARSARVLQGSPLTPHLYVHVGS